MSRSRWARKLRAAGLAVGAGLFVALLWRTGPGELAEALRRIGLGFLLVLAVSATNHFLRALAWSLALDPTGRVAPPWTLYLVRLSGEAVGQLTAAGPLFGEPAKAVLLRERVPLGEAAASVVVERTLFTLVTLFFVLVALAAWPLLYPAAAPGPLGRLALAAVPVAGLAGAWLLIRARSPLLSGPARRWAAASTRLERWTPRLAEVEGRVYDFYRTAPRRLALVAAVEVLAFVVGAAEWPVILYLLGHPVGLGTGLFLEAAGKILMASSAVIPGALGVYEAGAMALVAGVGAPPPIALATALVRRARGLVWTAVGLLSLARLAALRYPSRSQGVS